MNEEHLSKSSVLLVFKFIAIDNDGIDVTITSWLYETDP